MPNEQQQKELQTRLQMFKLVQRLNKGDTSAIIDELLALLEHFKTIPKGDTGIQGPKGDKGDKGDTGRGLDGKDYVLTEKDKQAIASKIKVPIVEKIIEKVEVIKEQPITTQQIREIAFSDTAEQIAEKMKNFKDAWLDIKNIKGLDDLLNETGNHILSQARGFVPNALASLYDTELGSPIDGQAVVWNAAKRKWIAGAVVSSSVGTGFTKEVPTGSVDGTNADFVFVTKPTYIVSDHSWYLENAGWTWAGSTATMSVPPVDDIWGFT